MRTSDEGARLRWFRSLAATLVLCGLALPFAGGAGARVRAGLPALSLAPVPAGYGGGAEAFAFGQRPNVAYMAVAHASDGVFVYKTTDDGQHWLRTGARGTGWDSDILSLTEDPTHPGTLYAGTDTAVYKTVNGGRSWQPYRRGLFPANGGKRVCSAPAVDGGLCVGHYFGTPGTTGWNRGNGWVLDLAVDPLHSGVVYAAAGGIRKSTDGGRTWKTAFEPTQWGWDHVAAIAIAPTRPESIYAIANNYLIGATATTAIYKSTDAGRTWHATGRLPVSCCEDGPWTALVVDAGNPETVYATVGQNVLVTTDGGATWQPMANGLPSGAVTSLATDPLQPDTLYAGVSTSQWIKARDAWRTTGGIYKTTDGGQTWTEVYTGFGVDKVAVDPARPSTIYAAGFGPRETSGARLLRSLDDGQTWTVAK